MIIAVHYRQDTHMIAVLRKHTTYFGATQFDLANFRWGKTYNNAASATTNKQHHLPGQSRVWPSLMHLANGQCKPY